MKPWPAILLVCAGGLAYANSFSCPFIFDDLVCIVNNPHIRSLGPPGDWWVGPPRSTTDGRPFLSLTLALNYAASGLDVRSWHAVNLLIHVAAALLLYGIVRRTLKWEKRDGVALAVAALWMLHPLQTESVTYVVQRSESLMGLLYLLTLYAAIRDWSLPAVLACALGMATKEVMVSAPLAVFLYDRCFRYGTFREAWNRRKELYLGLGATWLVLGACLLSGSQAAGAGVHSTGITHLSYVRTEAGVILHYLQLALFPDRLVLDYGWAPSATLLQDLPAVLGVLFLIGMTLWTLWQHPALGFPAACFFLILAPTSSILSLMDPAFEHRMYLPLAGVVVLFVMGGHLALVRMGATRLVQAALATGLAVGLCVLTAQRNRDYHSDLAIWADTASKRPQNYRAHNNLGIALQPTNPERALAEYREALCLNPCNAFAHYNLGLLLARRGEGTEALGHLAAAADLEPGNVLIRENFGVLLAKRGDYDKAVAQLSEAARLDPGDPEIRRNLELARSRKAGN